MSKYRPTASTSSDSASAKTSGGGSSAATCPKPEESATTTKVGLTRTQAKNLKRREKGKKQKKDSAPTSVGKTTSKKRHAEAANLGKTGETPEDKAQRSETDVHMDDSGTEEIADALAKSLTPLSKEEEEEIQRQEDGLGNEDEEPSAKKASYAEAAKKFKGVLRYVHSGTEERLPISMANFQTLWNRIEMELALNIDVVAPEPKVRWKSWKADRGLICFEDEESAKTIGELVAKIKVKSSSFRIWEREEKPMRLVRGPLPDFARGLEEEQIAKLLKVRNDLPGEILEFRKCEPKKGADGKPITPKRTSIGMTGGYSLSFNCDETLWRGLLQRSLKNKGKQVMLRIGIGRPMTYTLYAKNAEPEDEAAASTSEGPHNNEASKE